MADHWVRVVQKLPSPASRLHIRHAANEPWWPQVIDDYWSGRLGGLERVPSSKFAEVDRGSVGPEPRVVYFKRFLRRGSFDSFKHLVRASRAARAFAGIRLFSDAGFSSTCVSCIVEARRLGVVRESCLVTEEVPDAPSLTHWLFDDSFGAGPDRPRRRRFLRELGAEVGAIHAAGLYHGDMRHGNVLCREDGSGWRFAWLDLERSSAYSRLPIERRVYNLSQLNLWRDGLTFGDRWVFWAAYVERAGLDRAAAKNVLCRVVAETQRRWRIRGWWK